MALLRRSTTILSRSSTFPEAEEPTTLEEWGKEINQLTTAEEREEFFAQVKNVKSFADYVQSVQNAIKDANKSSRTLRVAKWIRPIFKTMKIIAPTAMSLSPVDDRLSGVVLGSITNMLSLSEGYIKYQECLEETIADMALRLDIVAQYGDSIFPKDVGLRRALIKLYAVILKFCVDASRLFKSKEGKTRLAIFRLGKSAWDGFEATFGEMKVEFERRLVEFQLAVGACRDRAILQSAQQDAVMAQGSTLAGLMDQSKLLEKKLDSIQQMEDTKRHEAETRLRREEYSRLREEKRARWENLLRYLPWESFDEVQEERFPQLVPGTGQWLYDLEEFDDWRTQSQSSLLWIHGKHGSGKSHVACRVIEDLRIYCEAARGAVQQEHDLTALAYVYCSSMNELGNDPKRLLGSVFKQLVQQLPETAEVSTLFRQIGDKHEPPTIGTIKKCIRILADWFAQTFFVFDGLDECFRSQNGHGQVKADDEAFQGFCEFIASLSDSALPNSRVRTLVFSRPKYMQIENAFAGAPQVAADSGSNAVDIKNYISNITEDLTRNQDILEKIKSKLLDGSDGMFLWVKLLVKTLRDECVTAREMERTVGKLPASLEEVYQLSLERIIQQPSRANRNRALKAIMWIANAKRPLSKTEMQQALIVEDDMTGWDEADVPEREIDLVAHCGDLIVLANNQYNLVHLSLQEYLRGSLSRIVSLEPFTSLQIEHARAMAMTCLTFVNFSTFKRGPGTTPEEVAQLKESYPFLAYAAVHWAAHLKDSRQEQRQELYPLVCQLLDCNGNRDLVAQLRIVGMLDPVYPFPGDITRLHFLSLFGVDELLESEADVMAHIDVRDGLRKMPIDYALVFDNRETAMWLLKKQRVVGPWTSSQPGRMPWAAYRNWSDAIPLLIELGAGINDVSSGGKTALHFAAQSGHIESLKALLTADADINAVNTSGESPLLFALSMDHLDAAQVLVDYGADVTTRATDRSTALHYAAKSSQLQMGLIKSIVGKGVDVNAVTVDENITAVYYATTKNRAELVGFLLQNGADCNISLNNGKTCLMAACQLGFGDCARLLLEAHCDVHAEESSGADAMYYAAINGKMDCMELLKNYGGSIDYKCSKDGRTALHESILQGNIDIARELIRHFHSDATIFDNSGWNALHYVSYAVKSQHICEFLDMLDSRVDINSCTKDGKTALAIAALGQNEIGTREILKRAPGQINKLNNDDETALHVAAQVGSTAVVQVLLEGNVSALEARDKQKNTPLIHAAIYGHLECLKLLVTTTNIDFRGLKGRTALAHASVGGHRSTVEFLLKAGASIDVTDDRQMTPLVLAVWCGHADIASILLEYGADPRLADEDGDTAMAFAAILGWEDFITRLLDDGYEDMVLRQGLNGFTPFSRAVLGGFSKIVDIFTARGYDGTHIRGSNFGHNGLVDAVMGRSYDILIKLIALHPESIHDTATALEIGLVECSILVEEPFLLRYLVREGLSIHGGDSSFITPLGLATTYGSLRTLNTLIRFGADVNEPTMNKAWFDHLGPPENTTLDNTTPLPTMLQERALDLAIRNPRAAAVLLEGGANLNNVGYLGTTAWMSAQPHVQVVMDLICQSERDHSKDCSSIKGAICDSLSQMLRLNKSPIKRKPSKTADAEAIDATVNGRTAVLRRVLNIIISQGLRQFGTQASLDDAKIVLTARASQYLGDTFLTVELCDICLSSLATPRYHCTICPDVVLCSDCYSANKNSEKTSQISPGLKEMERLETKTYAAHYICSSLDGGDAAAGILVHCAAHLKIAAANWLSDLSQKYEKWAESYPAFERFNPETRVGQNFVKLLKVATPDGSPTEQERENQRKEVKRQWKDLRHNIPERYELSYFTCHGHKYIEVRTKEEVPDDIQPNLDSEGNLTSEFLRTLYKRYHEPESCSSLGQEPNDSPNSCSTNLSDLKERNKSYVDAQMHWVEPADRYIKRLAANWNQFCATLTDLRERLQRLFDKSPVVEIMLGKRKVSMDTIEALDIDEETEDLIENALGLELAWQIRQVDLVGYVGWTLTDFVKYDTANPIPTVQSTNQQIFDIEHQFLSQLETSIQNHIINFVNRARHKRRAPPDFDAVEAAAARGSKAAEWRRLGAAVMELAPWEVYDFYSNELLTRLLWRAEPKVSGRLAEDTGTQKNETTDPSTATNASST